MKWNVFIAGLLSALMALSVPTISVADTDSDGGESGGGGAGSKTGSTYTVSQDMQLKIPEISANTAKAFAGGTMQEVIDRIKIIHSILPAHVAEELIQIIFSDYRRRHTMNQHERQVDAITYDFKDKPKNKIFNAQEKIYRENYPDIDEFVMYAYTKASVRYIPQTMRHWEKWNSYKLVDIETTVYDDFFKLDSVQRAKNIIHEGFLRLALKEAFYKGNLENKNKRKIAGFMKDLMKRLFAFEDQLKPWLEGDIKNASYFDLYSAYNNLVGVRDRLDGLRAWKLMYAFAMDYDLEGKSLQEIGMRIIHTTRPFQHGIGTSQLPDVGFGTYNLRLEVNQMRFFDSTGFEMKHMRALSRYLDFQLYLVAKSKLELMNSRTYIAVNSENVEYDLANVVIAVDHAKKQAYLELTSLPKISQNVENSLHILKEFKESWLFRHRTGPTIPLIEYPMRK